MNEMKEQTPSTGRTIDRDLFDKDAVRVVERLQARGYEAYLVGGCVRDLLVQETPKDFDIATSARPKELRSLFRNSRLIGRRFRLAHVYFSDGKALEVSTFRSAPVGSDEPSPRGQKLAASTGDGRIEGPGSDSSLKAPDLLVHEDNTFGTASEDARRRDFTINGLFCDPTTGRVIDHVGGIADLARRQIRTIGEPERRMREDPIRLLRAVRFSSRLQFSVEPKTYAAMEGAVEDLPRCAAPRLFEETFRLLRSGTSAKAVRMLDALGALSFLLPPAAEYLAANTPEARSNYFGLLAEVDAQITNGDAYDDAMLLTALLVPVALANAETAEASAVPAIESLFSDLARTARVPRRFVERSRLLLAAQRTLAGDRRYRGGLGKFRNHPIFGDAFAIFEAVARVYPQFSEAAEAWRSGSAPIPKSNASGSRRRRRRGQGDATGRDPSIAKA